MKLYYAAQTRATRPRWILEELGIPYELVRLDLGKGEHKKPEYLAIHPHGVVPALVDDDGTKVFESGAICAYLADKKPGLAPAVGTSDRGLYYQWIVYAVATLEAPILQVFLNTRFLPEAQRSAQAVEDGKKRFSDIADVVTKAIAGKEYLVGGKFTTADALVGGMLGWAKSVGLLEGRRELQEYVARLVSRPAFKRANAD